MEFLKKYEISHCLVLNGKDTLLENTHVNIHTEIEENLEISKWRFDGRQHIVFKFNTKSPFNYVHTRGSMVEFYVEDSKKVEIQIISNSLINITKTNDEIQIILFGDEVEVTFLVRDNNFLNKRLPNPNKIENNFESQNDLRYQFVSAENELLNDYLVVVFSAFSKEYTYNYNYVDTLKDFHTNKLFILDDYESKGSYYLGRDNSFSIETSVISLILNIAAKKNIPLNKIISIGSSKGGYSALYFGMKYSFGHVITLAPSLYLGRFLKQHYPDMFTYITGDSSKGDSSYLDSLIYRTTLANNHTKLKIMVGTKDTRKDRHVVPYINFLNQLNREYDYDLIEGVDHSQLKYFAPEYIRVQLAKILNIPNIPEMFITDIDFKVENNIAQINISSIGENIEYAYYWYYDNIVVEKVLYSNRTHSELPIEKTGNYRVRVFLRDKNKNIVSKSSRTIIINE